MNDCLDTPLSEVVVLCRPVVGGVRLLEYWPREGAFQLSIRVEWQLNLVIGAWYRWEFQPEAEVEASSVETKGHHRIHPALAQMLPIGGCAWP